MQKTICLIAVICLSFAFSSYGTQAGPKPSCEQLLSKLSEDLVTVYRGIIVERVEDLNLDYNYLGQNKTTYGLDFVSPNFRVAAIYLQAPEIAPNTTAAILVYKIPRELLDDRGNDIYAVPAEKLRSVGLSSPSVFLESIAMIKSELPPIETLSAQERKDLEEATRAHNNGIIKTKMNGFHLVFQTGAASSLLQWIPDDVTAAIKAKRRGFPAGG